MEIIVRVAAFVPRSTVTHLQVDDLFLGFIDESVTIARPGLETGAHAWREPGPSLIGMQRGVTLQDVHELVLLRMSMTQR